MKEILDIQQLFNIQNLVIYLLIINLFTFFMMWSDKRKAKKGKWRIPENTLLLFVLLGGGVGGIAGMYVFRHKTQKAKFFIGFPTILICEVILLLLLFT